MTKTKRTQFIKKLLSFLMNGSLKFVKGAMRILPRPLIDFFVEIVFSTVCLSTRKLHQVCVKNLKLVYGDSKSEKEYQLFARRLIKSIGHSMMDLLYYVERPDELLKIVRFEQEENLLKALDAGRGVIAVSAHMSNFPLMFVSLVKRGYKVNVIIRSMRDEDFSKFMFHLCAKWGINMIQTSPAKKFLRESLGALKRNELLFIILDEVVARQDGVRVPFFNHEVTRAPGPMLFSKRTGSPIVPIFITKDEKKHYRIFIEPCFQIYEGHDPADNIVKNIAGLTNIIERYVRCYPQQWGGWLNKRWAADNIS